MKANLWAVLFAAGVLTPAANASAAEQCNASATVISKIQGREADSPLKDKSVKVKALVSAVMPGLNGYFLVEEAQDWDDSDRTSEGVFVFDKQHKPNVGDVVALSATVKEFKGQTQLQDVSGFSTCGSGETIKMAKLSLPLKHRNALENYEGMPVEFEQALTISENYNLTRYGQLLLSNGRLYQPSNIAKPGKEAQKVAKANKLNQIILDDGSAAKNPKINLSVDHLYRVGNQIKHLQGVIFYSFGNYAIQPTDSGQLIAANPREAKPRMVKQGSLRVASFNVLNYFNGNGDEKAFPTKRGANSKAEFVRQNAKTIAAMKATAADVIGLMEVENDGFGQHSAIKELTDNLAQASGVNYRFVKTKNGKVGDDAISVGMIYNADKVSLVGETVTLSKAPFGQLSRLPMAQSFKQKSNGEIFTLVVNHFKSKGRCPKDKTDPNADQGDGQACWNHARVESSKQLIEWLKGNPTGVDDSDVLIIGDLNAYAKEQPVTTLEQAGYRNLLEKFQGKKAYSYVYRGLTGYLDHALASKSLVKQVVYASDWHINADELRATDYNLEFKTPQQQKAWFRPDALRSSDHDPVIIELGLK